MRVVFMGTPAFAVPSLDMLASAHEVVAVYTRPDAASGRGSSLRPSPVKLTALELGLEVLQPRTLRDAVEHQRIRALDADIIVVAAYGLILPPEVLDAAPFGGVNVHASLLPRWRGAAPVQRAILAGDAETGVSIMRVDVGLDTGDYCMQAATPVDEKTAVSLTEELATIGAAALADALPRIEDGTAVWIEQDEALATYANKVSKADVALEPDLAALDAVRRVRASLRTAPARALIAGRGVTVIAAEVVHERVASRSVELSDSHLVLGMSDGAIEVTRLKPDGKGEMDAAAWARGVRDLGHGRWGSMS